MQAEQDAYYQCDRLAIQWRVQGSVGIWMEVENNVAASVRVGMKICDELRHEYNANRTMDQFNFDR